MLNLGNTATSLRWRLFVRIVLPLIIVATVVGIWRTWNAFETAKEIFDRNLTAVSVAVARDVANAEGDLLSPETLGLLRDVSGGKVFYHVYGPDGAYVSGFGHPPRLSRPRAGGGHIPELFDATHVGLPVRAARLTQHVNASGLEGFATITVWQQDSVRQQFALGQAFLSLGMISMLVVAVMAFVWMGVGFGLAPLTRLRDTVAQRSPEDLRPISHAVPEEVRPLVQTLNGLFRELRNSIESRDRFIGNAAHQLRNPISAVRASAESALSARNPDDMRSRVSRTLIEAQHTSQLAEQLLTLEKLTQSPDTLQVGVFDVGRVVLTVATRFANRALDRGIDFGLTGGDIQAPVRGDPTLFSEAVENLLDNALTHGGEGLTSIDVALELCKSSARLSVTDDGRGIPADDREMVFERFAQLDHGQGSGLGLAIVREIVAAHGGTIAVENIAAGSGTRLVIELPLAPASDGPGE